MGVDRIRRWHVLEKWIKEHGWRKGVELGVLKGDTFLYLLSHCSNLELVGVDTWEPRLDQEPLREEGGRSYAEHDLTKYENDVCAAAFEHGSRAMIIKLSTVEAASYFPNHSFDFVFVDADHTYLGVKADIEAWMPKVKKGGVLCGHDANNPPFPGVARALNELCPGWTEHPDHVWQWVN